MGKNEKTKAEISLCVCEDLKKVMVGAVSWKFNPLKLYDQLEFVLSVEHDIKDFLDYEVILFDITTTVSTLKEERWK